MDCGPVLNTMQNLPKGIEENKEISRIDGPRGET